MKWTKKILFILIVGFCLFYLIQQPQGAAEPVRSVFGAIEQEVIAVGGMPVDPQRLLPPQS